MGDAGEGNYALLSGAGVDGGVVLAGRCSSRGESSSIRLRRFFLQRYDLEGAVTAVYAEKNTVCDFDDPCFVEGDELQPFQWAWDVGADGRVYAAGGRDDYELTVYGPDGEPEVVVYRMAAQR